MTTLTPRPFLKVNMASSYPNPKEIAFRRYIRRHTGIVILELGLRGSRTAEMLWKKGYLECECHRFHRTYRYTGKPVDEVYLVDENGSHLRDDDERSLYSPRQREDLDRLWQSHVHDLFGPPFLLEREPSENNPKDR